jgi:hypothetical protein
MVGLGVRPEATTMAPSSRAKLGVTNPKTKVGSIETFVRDQLFPADGERTEVKVLTQDYRAWCAQRGCEPLALRAFLDEIERLYHKLGIEIEVGDDQRVYCLNVRLGTATEEMATAWHLAS